MIIVSLNGDWTLQQAGEQRTIPAQVPGCVHLDLLANDLIDDPYFRDNESRLLWIGETDWTYRRDFDVTPDILAHDQVLLRCHGLDTLAAIRVNGVEIARTDNMYRTYEFDVKPHLVSGENSLEISFEAPMPYLRRQELEKGGLFAWSVGAHRLNGGGWLRKEPSNFGWDWGPALVTSGIWRDIELVVSNTARLVDLQILQDHTPDGVRLTLSLRAERYTDAAISAAISITLEGTRVAETGPVTFSESEATAELVIDDPQLWWPNGMGDQPLYTVAVELRDGNDRRLDAVQKRVGLRTLTLERHADEWGESFYFSANGVPFFAKGANWIPADTFVPRLTRDKYESLIVSAAEAHMNMLRVWGGGIYEPDMFYDACDEHGICIWQDFMFACGTYPTYDADFMANVKAEAADNVRRIRNHPCLALWCGNNELEQGLVGPEWTLTTMSWDDYGKLFDVLLRDVVADLDPERAYWPGSPHSPIGDRAYWWNPECGDAHLWEVWHQRKPLEFYRTTRHRFVSEFGLQSFPEPRTTAAFTLPEDRNITSYIMEYHQRSGIGNSTIFHYLLDWFRLPKSFDTTLWLSQIVQGLAMQIGIEHWRRSMPRTMGTLYWQLNDLWPAPTWSSIDVFGRWKALHYMAKRFYAPLLVSGLEDLDQGIVKLFVTSDAAESIDGTLTWTLTNTSGTALDSGDVAVTMLPRQSRHVHTVPLTNFVETHGARNLLLWAELRTSAGVVSTNLVTLARPKHLELLDPAIRAEMHATSNTEFEVTLYAEHPALYVWLGLAEHDARFSDNFFHMRSGTPHTVRLTVPGGITPTALDQHLTIQSLIDTYR